MRSVVAYFAAVVLTGMAGLSHAAEDPKGKTSAVSYEDAIRCAAVDTTISSVYESKDATEEEKALGVRFDKLLRYWLAHAIFLKGQDAALKDYQTASEKFVDEVKKAQSDGELERIVYSDMAKCAGFEKDVEFDKDPAGSSAPSADTQSN